MAVRPQCVKMAFTYIKESTYGNAVADGNINKLFEPYEPLLIDIAQTRIDDTDTIKGYEFPLNTDLDIITAQDINIPFSFPASMPLIGWLFAFAMGSANSSGNNNNYVHNMVPLDLCVDDQPPSMSWILGFGNDSNSVFKVKGLCINELKLALDKQGQLTVSGTAFTDGTMTSAANFNFAALASNTIDIPFSSHGDFLSANNGSNRVSKKTVLRGFDFAITNNLDLADGRSNIVSSNKTLTSLRSGNRQYVLTVRVEGHQGDEFYTDYMNATVKDVEVNVTISATRMIQIVFPKCKLINWKQSFDGIRDVCELVYKPFMDTAQTPDTPVLITVKNGDTQYFV